MGAAAAAALGVLTFAYGAAGAGFYVTDRGVRPLGRAGAFVAGADDQHAIWYNPAGLTLAGNGVLVDGSFINFGNTYQRQVLNGSDVVSYNTVSGNAQPLVIPTLIATYDFGQPHLRFAFGVFAPNAVITSWPDPDMVPANQAPQRYSLITLNGSLLAMTGLYVAYAPNDQLSIGIGVQALVGSFSSRIALSGCPATITCAPEDPDWDALAQINVGPIFAPTGNAGIRWQPSPYVVFGLSGQLPVWVNAPAQMQVRLPSHPFYEGAEVHGDRADVSFTLAPVLRAGIELRPTPHDRIELAGTVEFWSMHDKIALTPTRDENQPNGIYITGARGVGTYYVGPTAIERHFQNAYSIRLGAERDQDLGSGWHLWPRIGAAYETSATAPEYTSVLTFDTNKFLFTIGAGFGTTHLRIDATYAHMVANSVNVDPRDAMLYQVAPFRSNGQAPQDPVNAGAYTMSVDVFGLGLRYTF